MICILFSLSVSLSFFCRLDAAWNSPDPPASSSSSASVSGDAIALSEADGRGTKRTASEAGLAADAASEAAVSSAVVSKLTSDFIEPKAD